MIIGHGNDIYNYVGKIKCDFSSNIPYKNFSAEVIDHINGRLSLITHYPDPTAHVLTKQIAKHHNISPEQILITNGSAEAFYLLAHHFAEKDSVITYPSFAEYEGACSVHNHRMTFMLINKLTDQTKFNAKTIWFGLPNNPDGTIISLPTIEAICKNNPSIYLIIDNAYGRLCPQSPNIINLHHKYSNFISVHSLTKTFAIPGLRLGYIIANSSIINILKQLRAPWTVNALALEAGSFIMNNYSDLQPNSQQLCNESKEFQYQIGNIEELEVIPSPCNFFLVRMKKGRASMLKQYLIAEHGILIRNADNFRGLTPYHFRLSVQKQEDSKRLLKALKQYFTENDFD